MEQSLEMKKKKCLDRVDSAPKVPDSKRRRQRLIKLASGRAKTETCPEELVKNITEIQSELVVLTTKVQVLGEAVLGTRQLACSSGSMSVAPSAPLNTESLNASAPEFIPSSTGCAADGIGDLGPMLEQSVEDQDLYDRLACASCDKIAQACRCDKPAFEVKHCPECEFSASCGVRTLERIKSIIFADNYEHEPRLVEENCPLCQESHLEVEINLLQEHIDVCEECFGFDSQGSVLPCHAKDCINEGMFHERCMVAFPQYRFGAGGEDVEDAFLCREWCRLVGRMYTYNIMCYQKFSLASLKRPLNGASCTAYFS